MTPEARVRVDTVAILVVGFAAAVVIYLTAQPPPGNPLGYDPLDTKKYLHDLEVYGGKANVLAAELREWFASLWHGERLAFTVAVITVIAAGVFRFFATRLPEEQEDGADAGSPSEEPAGERPTSNVTRLTPRSHAHRARSGDTPSRRS